MLKKITRLARKKTVTQCDYKATWKLKTPEEANIAYVTNFLKFTFINMSFCQSNFFHNKILLRFPN